MLRRRSLPLLAALGALAVCAPSANALTQTDYAVTIEGSASYARHDAVPGAQGDWTTDVAAEWTWKATIPTVTFFDDRFSMASVPTATGTVKSGSLTLTIPTLEGPKVGSCTGKAWDQMPGAPIMTGQTEKPEGASSEGIFIRVMEGGGVRVDQCTGMLKGTPQTFGVGSPGTGRTNAYETFFEMPHEAVGMGKIIQLLDRTVTGTSCPGYTEEQTDSCTLTWKATVTFVRTFHAESGEPGVKPAPPGEQTPPPAPAPPVQEPVELGPEDLPLPPRRDEPAPTLEDLFIPLPGSARLAPSGARATVTVVCPTGCQGTAVARPAGARARAAGAAKPLARTRFRAKPGVETVVALRLGARARRAVRRAGGVKITLDAAPKGGARVRRTVVVRSG